MLIGDLPRRNRKLYPNKIAVIDGPIQLTFAEFDRRINRLANAIRSLGLNQGDRVAVLYGNGYQYLELYFATAKAGTPIIPLNYRLVGNELSTIITDSDPKLLFFGKEYLPVAELLGQDHPQLQHYACVDGVFPGVLDYEEMIARSSDADPAVPIDEDDMAILGYTGGTTGRPKGVMTTHKNVITNCFQSALAMNFHAQHRFLSVSPLFHAGGATGFLRFSLVGGSNVIMNSSAPETILQHIQDCQVTHSLFVPSVILRLLQTPDISRYDLSSLQCIMYGTAPMHYETLKKAMNTFRCDFAQVYGATETFTTISILTPADHALYGDNEPERLTSAGRQVCGVDIKIVNDQNQEVPLGEIGEVIVKGNNVMKGYWKRSELTSETVRDGWYYTGDMGRLDELAYLYIVDRKKDMIISGGENIYPKEVEEALFKHPAVVDCAVVGVPDDLWGESVKALVIVKPGASVTESDLIDHCKLYLASYKKPKSIEFVPDFPRSTAGKILKNQLRDPYWKHQMRKV